MVRLLHPQQRWRFKVQETPTHDVVCTILVRQDNSGTRHWCVRDPLSVQFIISPRFGQFNLRNTHSVTIDISAWLVHDLELPLTRPGVQASPVQLNCPTHVYQSGLRTRTPGIDRLRSPLIIVFHPFFSFYILQCHKQLKKNQ